MHIRLVDLIGWVGQRGIVSLHVPIEVGVYVICYILNLTLGTYIIPNTQAGQHTADEKEHSNHVFISLGRRTSSRIIHVRICGRPAKCLRYML